MRKTRNKLYLSYEDVEGFVMEIGREIMQSEWKPDYIVGVGRGGLLPATLLSHFIDVPMHSLDVSLRDSNIEPTSNCWMAEDAYGYVDTLDRDEVEKSSDEAKRKNILIVDDINDTGATINWIKDDWKSGCIPDDPAWDDIWLCGNVRTAVLVNNEASEYKNIDYAGMDINKAEDDKWVVFPYENFWNKN